MGERTTARRADNPRRCWFLSWKDGQYDAYEKYDTQLDTPDAPCDTADPETKLLLAVLERTILDLGGKGREHGHVRPQIEAFALDAFEWIADESDALWSFTWVCDHLALNIPATRARMFVLATRLRTAALHHRSTNLYATSHH